MGVGGGEAAGVDRRRGEAVQRGGCVVGRRTRDDALDGDPALLHEAVEEVVLGIDNLIFISILTNKLPIQERSRTRRIGIGCENDPGRVAKFRDQPAFIVPQVSKLRICRRDDIAFPAL